MVSAETGEGIETLLTAIEDRLAAFRMTLDLSIDASDGAGISWLHRNAEVLTKELHGERNPFFGKADNAKLAKVKTVDDLNTPDITVAYFTGTPPETWLPTRLPKATIKGVQGSGANAPTDEIMSGRADVAPIDTAAWVDMAKKIPGLVVFPKGDTCLTNGEFPTDVGMAIDKNQPEFLAWLQAVYKADKDKISAEELRVLKE